MRQKIIGTDINNYETALNNTIDNNIIPRINEMKTVFNDINWQGEGKESFVSNYNNIMFEINKIPKVLKLYMKFLDSSMTNYKELMIELKKNFDNLEEVIEKPGDLDEQ